ncbi:hypothetical protein [Nostoc sp. PCC 9305]|uniref:hypothetical protein n=1 Tax=Nostoc sp. PCC 9305 TaxID=296636 RepID=UPI0039C6718D
MSRTTVPFLTNLLTMLFCTQYWCRTSQKVRSHRSDRRSLFFKSTAIAHHLFTH